MNRSMIVLFFFVFALLLNSTVSGQVPRQISYQGFITNAEGDAIDGAHDLSIKIYSSTGTLLYTESYTGISVSDGVFSLLLGAGTPLPPSLDFKKQYFLGVSVDGGAELTPRTPFASAPYALRAEVADALASGSDFVTSANGITGDVKITGGGATTVTRSNDTIFISSSGGGGGSGIQGVQNGDGTLSISNPNGPVATINLQSVPVTKLGSSGAVENQFLKFNGALWTPSTITDYLNIQTMPRLTGTGSTGNRLDLAQQGASAGQVLKWDGNSWSPGSDNTNSFSFPASVTLSNSSTLFTLTNSGSGRAASFSISSNVNTSEAVFLTTSGSGNALAATSTGAGSAGAFSKNVASPNVVLSALADVNATGGAFAAQNNGAGVTAAIRTANANNSSNVLEVSTTGTGRAAYFQVNNSSNATHAIDATSNGSGHTIFSSAGHINASAIFGFHGGPGIGVTGSSTDGLGVYGVSVSAQGVRGLHNSALGTSAGVEGKTNSITPGNNAFGGATGVYGEITSTNPGIWTAGVRGYNKGTGGNGVGVTGLHDGSGYGVYGESVGAGRGVMGVSNNNGFGGYFDIPGGGGGWGVYASTAAKPGGGVWAAFSDRTMKKDVRPFNDGLDIIERINPVRYHYNGKGGMPTEPEFVGIIAQDMQPLMPYALREARSLDRSDEKFLSFDASALTYIQVNAIKELSAKLEAMQVRIETLEALLRDRGIDPNGVAGK